MKKKKCRCIEFDFEEWVYIPKSKNEQDETCVIMEKDEIEALRLVDGCHLSQLEAAKCMDVSSSTIQRIIERAREKLIRSIVKGHILKIHGGNYKVKEREEK